MTNDNFDDEKETPSIVLPSFFGIDCNKYYDYENQVIDYNTLDELDKAMQNVRIALFKITDNINTNERKEKKAEQNYKRSYRRAYLASSGKTETARKAYAELLCEEIENEWLKYQQLNIELIRISQILKQEMQALQAIGNNLRLTLKS